MPEPSNQILNPSTPLPPVARRFSFTGRLKAGKDHCAKLVGAQIFGLADPLYALQKMFFGTDDKSANGARKFLQDVGQWGRGLVSPAYPLSTERASFVASLILLNKGKHLPADMGVKWADYGINENIWLDALLERVRKWAGPTNVPLAVTNCRFDNEKKALSAAGFVPFHVMCSAGTWAARLAKSGLSPDSPEVKNISEEQAIKMDNSVAHIIKTAPIGPRLRVIWSDSAVCPSPRLLTEAQFIEMAKL